MKKIPLKLQLSLFLFAFLIFLSLQEGNSLLFIKSMIALITCVILDSLLFLVKTKKFKITESSLISGLIIGFVLSSSADWWFFILSGVLAIISKYLIRYKGKHIFNPAALGIFLVAVIFKQATQWHGAYSWYIIIPFGLYLVWKIRKTYIIYAYFLTYILFCGIQSYWSKTPFLDQIYYANYFFIFIMLIEPKTSPFDLKGMVTFGIMVSAISSFFYWANLSYDADLPALLIANCIFFFWQFKKRR